MTYHSLNVVKMLLLGHTLADEDASREGWEYWASAAHDKWERETVEVEELGIVEVFYEGSRPSDYETFDSNDRALIFKVGGRVFRKTGEYASHGIANNWDGEFVEVSEEEVEKTTFQVFKTVDDMSPRQIEELLAEFHDDEGDGWYYWDYEVAKDEIVSVLGLGDVTKVFESGEHKWESELVVVLKLSNGRHFQKKGHYASYEGSTWDGPFVEVTPVQELVTVYKPIGE